MENMAMKTIEKYLPGLQANVQAFQLKGIPALFQKLYNFQELDIHGKPYLLIKVKSKELGPKDFKKHGRRLYELIAYPQIWHLKELHPHKIRRMIENQLNFIVENKQVHLPTINISIKAEVEKVKSTPKFLGMSINLLIREILNGDLSGKSKVEIAEIFNTSKMSIGRAIEPLLVNDLCNENKSGVAKKIQFKNRLVLWNYLKKNIKSPVKEVIYLGIIPQDLAYSGISALSRQSLLTDDTMVSFAIEKREFNKKYQDIKFVLEDEAMSKIELWDRPVTLITNSNINEIDLYLVLKEVNDERVQLELKKILIQHNLEVGRS